MTNETSSHIKWGAGYFSALFICLFAGELSPVSVPFSILLAGCCFYQAVKGRDDVG